VVTLNGQPAVQAVLLDITEAVRVQDALRRSEEKYRSLVENINEIIFTVDPSGLFTYVSPVIKQLLGYEPAEIIGKPFDCFVHSDDAPALLVAFERCDLDSNSPQELRVMAHDGNLHLMRISCSPSYDGDQFKGITGVMADITETKIANEIIRERQQMYETLLRTTTDAIATVDLEGNFTEASERTARLFGFQCQEDLVGKNAFSFVIPAHHRKALTSFKEALKSGYIRDKGFTFTRADGSHFLAQIDAALIHDAQGRPKSFILTIRDVTESKRAERQLRRSQQRFDHIVTLISEWVWEVDPSCVITYSNSAIADILGYQPDEILGTYIYDHFDSRYDPKKNQLLELVDSRSCFRDFKVAFLDKQRRPVDLILHGMPILDEDKNLLGYRGTARACVHQPEAQAEQTLRKMLTLDEAIILTDLTGRILFLNERAQQLAGFASDRAVDHKIDDVFRIFTTCGSPSQIELSDLRSQVENGKLRGKATLKQPSGDSVNIAFTSAIVYDASGYPSGILLIFAPTRQ